MARFKVLLRRYKASSFALYFARSPKKTFALAVFVIVLWNGALQLGGMELRFTPEDTVDYNRMFGSREKWSWWGKSNSTKFDTNMLLGFDTHVHVQRTLQHTTTTALCTSLHIVVLVSGQEEARNFTQLMMTILAHRTNPLVIHVISDNVTSASVKLLFDTWELPGVESYIYENENIVPVGSDTDYRRAAIILNLRKIIDIEEPVVVLGPSMRIGSNLINTFSEFSKFSKWESLGLWTWYKQTSINDLVVQYSIDIVLVYMKRLQMTHLASREIKSWEDFNSLLSRRRGIIRQLACSFNMRLEPDEDIADCLQKKAEPRAVWWGPLVKHTFVDAKIELIKERIEEIVSSDGELFRFSSDDCILSGGPIKTTPQEPTDSCAEYRIAASLKRRTHINFIGNVLNPSKDPYDVTLVTALTLDRWNVLEKIVTNWKGPLSVVLYLSDLEANSLPDRIAVSEPLSTRDNIIIHVVYKRPRHIAINYLRNIGISVVKSPFTLMMDVDLVPSPNMYPYLKESLRTQRGNDSVALVVPALEAYEPLPEFPGTKSEVISLWSRGKLNGFGMDRAWNLGHKPTDFDKWKASSEPYFVEYERAFEPYVVLPTKTMPKYDERFLDRMADKIVYAQEVFALGYTFKVLTNCYVIHLPHATSQSKQHWLDSKTYKPCGFTLLKELRAELEQKYPSKKIPFA